MRSKRPVYFLAVFILPLLFFIQNRGIAEPIHGFSFAILKPLLLAADSVKGGIAEVQLSAVRFWQAFRDRGELEEKITRLESELDVLREASRENERLKKLLGFKETVKSKAIPARVIGWEPSAWRKTLILDKGKLQGIQKDMAVVVAEGLVGRVLEAGPSTSRVLLLTDPDGRVSAMTSETRAQGMVAGDGSPFLTLEYLEMESGAKVEETVITSGMTGLFPKGIRVGKITALSRDASGLHLQARLEPFVQFSKLEEVLCLASSPQKS